MSGADELDTPLGDISPKVAALRATFNKGESLPLEARRTQILAIRQCIADNTEDLIAAVHKDVHRHPAFSQKIIAGCVKACDTALANMDAWCAVQPLPGAMGNTCQVRYIPKGVALVVGTWNFPNPLVWKPLIAALTAGNVVMVKLSEVSFCAAGPSAHSAPQAGLRTALLRFASPLPRRCCAAQSRGSLWEPCAVAGFTRVAAVWSSRSC